MSPWFVSTPNTLAAVTVRILQAPSMSLLTRKRHSQLYMTHSSTVSPCHGGDDQSVPGGFSFLRSPTLLHPSTSCCISSLVFPPVWAGPWSFHNSCYLMLFCLDLSKTGGVSSSSTHNYKISYLSPVPRSLPCGSPSSQFTFCPAVWEDMTGVSCHTPKGWLGFQAMGLAHVLTV